MVFRHSGFRPPIRNAPAASFSSQSVSWPRYQVESWFSRLQRDVIDRGIFTSVADLKRKILR
jgi:hypothetical protein